MDGDEVRDLQYLLDGHALGVLLLEDLGGEVGIVGHDLHPEGKGADVRENSLEDAFALAMGKSEHIQNEPSISKVAKNGIPFMNYLYRQIAK